MPPTPESVIESARKKWKKATFLLLEQEQDATWCIEHGSVFLHEPVCRIRAEWSDRGTIFGDVLEAPDLHSLLSEIEKGE